MTSASRSPGPLDPGPPAGDTNTKEAGDRPARRLLLAGLYQPASGLTQVLTRLAAELSRAFEVSVLGFAPTPTRAERSNHLDGIPVHVRAGPYAQFGADPAWLRAEMAGGPPDTVLTVGPAFLAAPFLAQLQAWRPGVRLVLYLPMEGEPGGPALVEHLRRVDVCLTYTKAARDGLQAMVLATGDGSEGRIEHVGHGVDLSAFEPLQAADEAARRRLARGRAFPGRPELDGAFIALCVARPYRRKRLDLTVEGFARFARDRPDAWLVLHLGRRSARDGDLLARIANSGVADRILVSPDPAQSRPSSVEDLNLLYNACDVGISTAMGEGWGLTTYEHAATGAAQILPDHTSFRESWTGSALMLPCHEREFVFYESATMAATSADNVAWALETLYRDPACRAVLADAARRRVLDPELRWGAVARRITRTLSLRSGVYSCNHNSSLTC